MQTFRLHSSWKRWTPMMATAIGGMALLLWHREAQPQTQTGLQTQAQTKPQRPVQSREPEEKSEYFRIIKIGNYHLKIADADSIWAARATEEEKARLRADRLRAAERVISGASGNNASQTLPPGPGVGSGRSFTPNLVLDVEIEGRNSEDALLIQGFQNVHAQDDRGQALRCPTMPFRAGKLMVRPEQDAKRQARLGFLKEADARSLKTIEGEFVVTNGVVRTLEFAGDELHSGASKRLGQIDTTIDNYYLGSGHVAVSITCITGQFEPRYPIGLQENLERMELGERTIQMELVGTDGVAYRNSGSSGSSHRVRALSVGADGVARRDGTVEGLSTVTSKLSFSFPAIPEGIRPQKMILRVVEQQGENFRVPFKFTDIPLADPL
jgi:hypothetical protein